MTPQQKAEALALVRGPRGGRLRGRSRPTSEEFCAALAHWPRMRLASALFWLTLAGGIR